MKVGLTSESIAIKEGLYIYAWILRAQAEMELRWSQFQNLKDFIHTRNMKFSVPRDVAISTLYNDVDNS